MPWNSNEQVEQDLLISRALVAIFGDEFLASELAFWGGTALHKLYLSPRPHGQKQHRRYMEFSVPQPPTNKQFIANMEEKIADPFFVEDTQALLRSGTTFDHAEAYELVKMQLLDRLK